MRPLNFFSPSFGVGTTTIATGYLLRHATPDNPIWMGVDDSVRYRAVALSCGQPAPHHLASVTLTGDKQGPAATVVDLSEVRCECDVRITDAYMSECNNVLVITPDYVRLAEVTYSLRNYITGFKPTDGFVLFNLPGRVLTAKDVTTVLPLRHIATMPYDAAVPRAIDSGLLTTRMPETLRRVADAIHAHVNQLSLIPQGDDHE